jgi:hypothetical protein
MMPLVKICALCVAIALGAHSAYGQSEFIIDRDELLLPLEKPPSEQLAASPPTAPNSASNRKPSPSALPQTDTSRKSVPPIVANGAGTPLNKLAVLENSAGSGDARAMRDLAFAYRDGIGTIRDFDKAAYWLKKSVEHDYAVKGDLDDLEIHRKVFTEVSDADVVKNLTADQREVMEFMNSYVGSTSTVLVINPPCGKETFITSLFKFDGYGNIFIERNRLIQCSDATFGSIRWQSVNVKDLDPSDIGISNNPGFGYSDILFACRNRAQCVYSVTEFRSDRRRRSAMTSDILDIPIGERMDVDRLVRAFRAAIGLFGGKRSKF